MNKRLLTELFLIGAIILTLSSNSVKADPGNTKFAGFAIGDSSESASKNCTDNLKYTLEVMAIQPGVFGLVCVLDMDPKDPTYKSLISGKPDQISILIEQNKIVGLHLTYSNKLTFKKALADFVSSGIMIEGLKENHPTIHGALYKNEKEKWYGWHFSFSNDTNDVNNKEYVIHLETAVNNTAIDELIDSKPTNKKK